MHKQVIKIRVPEGRRHPTPIKFVWSSCKAARVCYFMLVGVLVDAFPIVRLQRISPERSCSCVLCWQRTWKSVSFANSVWLCAEHFGKKIFSGFQTSAIAADTMVSMVGWLKKLLGKTWQNERTRKVHLDFTHSVFWVICKERKSISYDESRKRASGYGRCAD